MKTPNLFFRALCCFFAVQMALPTALLAQLVISIPTFPTTNTVHFALSGTQSTNAHIIFTTPDLSAPLAGSNRAW
jgi:hypothetical protein